MNTLKILMLSLFLATSVGAIDKLNNVKVSISFFIIYSLIISVSSVNNCPSIGILPLSL
jgi:hypothetical protein